MKTTMKFFAALAIMMGFTMGAMAQTQSITANAKVINVVTIGVEKTLEFGNVFLTGGPKTISVAGVATGLGNAGGISNQGIFSIAKTSGTALDLTFTVLPGTLAQQGDGATGTLPIATYLAGWNADATSATMVASVSTTLSAITTIPALNADPTIYVHIGATVTPNESTVAGIYQGSLTLSAVYN